MGDLGHVASGWKMNVGLYILNRKSWLYHEPCKYDIDLFRYTSESLREQNWSDADDQRLGDKLFGWHVAVYASQATMIRAREVNQVLKMVGPRERGETKKVIFKSLITKSSLLS